MQLIPSKDEGSGAGSYWSLLRNGNFLRFFSAQCVSSLGDWIGVIAIAFFALRLGGNAGVGAVMTARVLPGFIVGPIGGVIADRYDRRKLMVTADLARAVIIFSIPFVPNLIYLLLASAALESLTLVWGPAKDASLPHFVPRNQLPNANSLSLIAIYAPWPLASIVFAALVPFATFLGEHVPALSGLLDSQESLALWLDAATFAFSAAMIYTLAIPSSRRRSATFDFSEAKRDLVEGLRFVRDHKQVRPWLLGVACTFVAAGGVFSLGPGFMGDVLGAGQSGFGFLIGFLATGMIVGLLAAGYMARFIQKDVLYSSCLFLLGAGLIALASVGSLEQAIPIGSALGFFGGMGYSTAYSLMQEHTSDEIRGRTFSAAYTIIRIGTLIGLGLFPFIAGAIGDHSFGSYPLSGSRITLWIAGLVVMGGGVVSLTAIKAARAAAPATATKPGYFVVFEGGEGAGKSTQMEAMVEWLRARGEDVVTTREPGGTEVGERIRAILLDPAARELDPRAEALLYAADRAQHVSEVIRPALEAGKVVVSDRFVDSSLAYQGLARGLGLEEVYEISAWAVDGTMPDLVLFLRVDPKTGLGRIGPETDRIEGETAEFHERVAQAYEQLTQRFPERFAVLDADRAPAEVHLEIQKIYNLRRGEPAFGAKDLPAPGAPVPR